MSVFFHYEWIGDVQRFHHISAWTVKSWNNWPGSQMVDISRMYSNCESNFPKPLLELRRLISMCFGFFFFPSHNAVSEIRYVALGDRTPLSNPRFLSSHRHPLSLCLFYLCWKCQQNICRQQPNYSSLNSTLHPNLLPLWFFLIKAHVPCCPSCSRQSVHLSLAPHIQGVNILGAGVIEQW